MAEKEGTSKNLQGIGGWLLFFVIWMGFSIVYFPIQLASSYINPLVELNIVYTTTSIVSWLLSVSMLILIFMKKSWVPKYIIAVIWFQFVIGLTSLSNVKFNFSSQLESTAALVGVIFGLVFGIVWAIIWNPYFVKSQRVKNTFIN